jgi:hypothetical protein
VRCFIDTIFGHSWSAVVVLIDGGLCFDWVPPLEKKRKIVTVKRHPILAGKAETVKPFAAMGYGAVRHYSLFRSVNGTIGLGFYKSDDAANYVVTEVAPNVRCPAACGEGSQ